MQLPQTDRGSRTVFLVLGAAAALFSSHSNYSHLSNRVSIHPINCHLHSVAHFLASIALSHSHILDLSVTLNDQLFSKWAALYLTMLVKVMGIKIKKEELQKMISDVDSSGDGDIDFSEFLQMMTGKMVSPPVRPNV